jgi:hypothetical protein
MGTGSGTARHMVKESTLDRAMAHLEFAGRAGLAQCCTMLPRKCGGKSCEAMPAWVNDYTKKRRKSECICRAFTGDMEIMMLVIRRSHLPAYSCVLYCTLIPKR